MRFRVHRRRCDATLPSSLGSQHRNHNHPSLLARKTYAGVHGSLRGRQPPPHDGHPSGSTFLCNARGLQNSRTTPSGMAAPTPRQGRLDASEGRTRSGSAHGGASKRQRRRHQASVLIGSKAQPSRHIACMITASLRATATTARLKPTLSFSFRPRCAARYPI
jgi:hypothetical protein